MTGARRDDPPLLPHNSFFVVQELNSSYDIVVRCAAFPSPDWFLGVSWQFTTNDECRSLVGSSRPPQGGPPTLPCVAVRPLTSSSATASCCRRSPRYSSPPGERLLRRPSGDPHLPLGVQDVVVNGFAFGVIVNLACLARLTVRVAFIA